MRIGIDLDECLTEFVFSFLNYYNNKYGTKLNKGDIRSYDFCEFIGCSKEESTDRIYGFYETSYFKELPVVFGSKNGVRSLSSDNELFVITSRPEYIAQQTERWLEHHFHNRFSDIIFANELNNGQYSFKRTKSEVCAYLGVEFMIEDDESNARDCAFRGVKVFLIDQPWNQDEKLHSGIKRVYDWNEIFANIRG